MGKRLKKKRKGTLNASKRRVLEAHQCYNMPVTKQTTKAFQSAVKMQSGQVVTSGMIFFASALKNSYHTRKEQESIE